MKKIFYSLQKYILYIVIFLLPITVVTISPNPYVVTKLAILFFGIAAILLVMSVKTISDGKLELSLGNFDFPVLLIALAYILSTIFRTSNKMEAILLPGTATVVITSVILYFLINQLTKKDKDYVSQALLLSGAVYSLLIFLAFTGLLAKIPQLPAFIKAKTFSPEGGYLPSAMILAAIAPLGAGLIISEKSKKQKVVLASLLCVLIVGFGIALFNILPGKPTTPRFPSVSTSWFIAVDTLKVSPILGVGPGNYLTAFNRFRPIGYNTTDLWALKFSTATNQFMTMLTETGLLGAAGVILLLIAIYKFVKKDIKEKKLVGWGFAGASTTISLVLLIVFLALFPATTTSTVLFFIILALVSTTNKTSLNLTTEIPQKDMTRASGVTSRFPAILISLPVLALLAYTGFYAVKIIKAEFLFRQALTQLSQNEAVKSYETMRNAINTNPYVDRYHASYSQINLALANAIAQNAEITDQDRTNIAQLIQQAIREGKSTVALNQLRAGNWEILARTYRTIIPLAQGADTFAAQSYAQAVALDPYNPNTRIALGGLYYAAGNFETAIRIFELAVTTKPDLANSHYNLAYAYREAGRYDQAINQMTLVLSLIDKSSNDYQIATQALEDMQSKKSQAGSAPSGVELTGPAGAPEPLITPPIELPNDANPPEAPITATPTPTEGEQVTPTVTVSVTPTPAP
jgi:tetratricopeptide (TPR) repeat protein